MKKEVWVKVCPYCQSKNFSVDKSDKLVSFGVQRGYVCGKCKKTFRVPLEISKE